MLDHELLVLDRELGYRCLSADRWGSTVNRLGPEPEIINRWAKAIGPNMAQLIDVVLRSAEFEEQSYNSCNGILHMCDKYPKSYGEEAAAHCVKMKSMRYSAFKKAMNAIVKGHGTFTAADDPAGQMPETENVRGKDHWN